MTGICATCGHTIGMHSVIVGSICTACPCRRYEAFGDPDEQIRSRWWYVWRSGWRTGWNEAARAKQRRDEARARLERWKRANR